MRLPFQGSGTANQHMQPNPARTSLFHAERVCRGAVDVLSMFHFARKIPLTPTLSQRERECCSCEEPIAQDALLRSKPLSVSWEVETEPVGPLERNVARYSVGGMPT